MSENALVKQQTNLTEVKKDDNKKIFFSLKKIFKFASALEKG